MVKSKEASKIQECEEKTLESKKNKGYKEPKDPLINKAKRHSVAALKKNANEISDNVAIAQKAVIDDIEIPNNEGESLLRYKDSENKNIPEKVFAYEKMNGTTIPLDYDSDGESFLVSVKKSEIDGFRTFMKDFEEIPLADQKIEEIQSKRSNRAIAIDKSITASRVGRKENPIDLKEWAESPNTLDLLGVDAPGEK